MKKYILILSATILATTPTFASNKISDYEKAVGSETIIRQVILKRYLSHDKDKIKELKMALEGSGTSSKSFAIVAMSCEKALASDYCSISIAANNLAASYEVQVRIYQGTVVSASVQNIN